jgi:hypothetical protein
MVERANEEWLTTLRGSERDEALADLRALLLRGLGYALGSRSDIDDKILMGTNRNALYKLLHDARQRLRAKMEAEGLSYQDMLQAFAS